VVISLLASMKTSPVSFPNVGRGVCAFQIVGRHFHALDLGLLNSLNSDGVIFLPCATRFSPPLVELGVRELESGQALVTFQ